MTRTMKLAEAKTQLAALVDRVSRTGERLVVEDSGVPVATIVSTQELERLDRLDRERAERFKALETFGDAFKDVPVEEQEREVARAIAEVRAEDEQQATAKHRPA